VAEAVSSGKAADLITVMLVSGHEEEETEEGVTESR
jgi:hypothetical protein